MEISLLICRGVTLKYFAICWLQLIFVVFYIQVLILNSRSTEEMIVSF